ncbi:MAG: GNAT family N-acetyltransferase [Candidatus Heimdallarchaeota archaeon]
MAIRTRSYNWEEDLDLARTFFIETYKLANSFQHWVPTRFENEVFNDAECGQRIRIWEIQDQSSGTASSKIVAMAILNPPSYYTVHSHPDFKFLEKEIIAWVEQRWKQTAEDTKEALKINTFALGTDKERIALLSTLGYQNIGLYEYSRTRPDNAAILEHSLPAGFNIRNIQGEDDYPNLIEGIALVFNHNLFTEEVYRLMMKTSFYNQELDLVAIAPNGAIAAFCMVRIDPVSKIAEFEPVGTLPKYRELGLAKALMIEGLERAVKYQPSSFYIGAATHEAANRLYESLGFTDKIEVFQWQKRI